MIEVDPLTGLSRTKSALTGLLSTGVALAVGELAAGLTGRLESFVVAVAEVFIDITPGGIVRASIETLGATQKTVLLVGVTAGTLGLGALIGLVARRQEIWAVCLFTGLGVFGTWAVARNPLTSAGLSWVVGAIAITVGVVTLLRAPNGTPPSEQEPEDPKNTYADRRGFFGWVTGMSVAAGAMTGVGRIVLADESVQNARGGIILPDAAMNEIAASPGRTPSTDSAPPTTEATTVPGGVDEVTNLSPYITPNESFYRIDTALSVPMVDPETWSLSVGGLVENPYRLTFADLLAMDLIERTVTLCCVSNEVGGSLVGNATWTGIPLEDVLGPAGPLSGGEQVMAQSVDGFTAGFPIEHVSDGRTALLAVGMNGEPLPILHGFPARLVVAGLYGYVSAVKWLDSIKVTTWEDNNGYWIPRGWAKEAPIKIASRIDVPKPGRLKAGVQPVAGVAWSPIEGVARVEVSVDDGPWKTCELGDTVGGETWVQWLYRWEAKPGRHELTVRTVGSDGTVQPSRPVKPAPNGAEGHHSVKVTVL